MINSEEFKRRYQIFLRLDYKNYPHTFYEFWRYKLKVESQDGHILDYDNKIETLSKLGPILKLWQWNRPYEFEYCFNFLKKSIENISDSYNRIKTFSLINFDEVPENELKIIWNELGSIKDQRNDNLYRKLIMTITKPLMFLWGQTPAFDTVLRAKMPLFNLNGFKEGRWGFNLWINVMKKLQRYLHQNSKLVVLFRKMSREKYGTDKIVPYGQFFDLYYWTEDKLDNGSKIKDPFHIKNKQRMDFEKTKQREEFSKLITLLNKLRSNGKISADERRNYSKQWEDQPHNQDLLIEQLKLMLNK